MHVPVVLLVNTGLMQAPLIVSCVLGAMLVSILPVVELQQVPVSLVLFVMQVIIRLRLVVHLVFQILYSVSNVLLGVGQSLELIITVCIPVLLAHMELILDRLLSHLPVKIVLLVLIILIQAKPFALTVLSVHMALTVGW